MEEIIILGILIINCVVKIMEALDMDYIFYFIVNCVFIFGFGIFWFSLKLNYYFLYFEIIK